MVVGPPGVPAGLGFGVGAFAIVGIGSPLAAGDAAAAPAEAAGARVIDDILLSIALTLLSKSMTEI